MADPTASAGPQVLEVTEQLDWDGVWSLRSSFSSGSSLLPALGGDHVEVADLFLHRSQALEEWLFEMHHEKVSFQGRTHHLQPLDLSGHFVTLSHGCSPFCGA